MKKLLPGNRPLSPQTDCAIEICKKGLTLVLDFLLRWDWKHETAGQLGSGNPMFSDARPCATAGTITGENLGNT